MKKQMLNTLSSDVVLLAGGNQAANCPIPDISPAPPPDYHALLCHPNDFEFSVNGCYVRIWNAAGCLELNREYHIALYLPQALAIGDDGGGGLFLYMTEQQGWGAVYCRAADLDAAEAAKIADSLHGLLVEGRGRAQLAALYSETK